MIYPEFEEENDPEFEEESSVDPRPARGGHPMQPVVLDPKGIPRFKINNIVRFLLDAGPFNLDQLALMPWPQEDYEQLMQLIGYSVSSAGDLSTMSREVIAEADRQAEALLK